MRAVIDSVLYTRQKKSTKDFGAMVMDTGQWDKPTYLNNQPHLKLKFT